MEVLALFNGKGGVGKSTLTPSCAAAIKKLFPELAVGIIAADTDQRSLAWSYAPDYENEDRGIWDAIASRIDRRTAKDVELHESSLKSGIRRLRVIPGVSDKEGCIDFMACAGEIGKQFAAVAPLGQKDSHETLGMPLLIDINKYLGWDLCILDMPGSIKDPLVMALLPCCTSVVIVSDVLKEENLTMEEEVVSQLRAVKVATKGFLANKVTDSKASKDALQELEAIASRCEVPILAKVRALDTLAVANRAFSATGESVQPNARWTLPEGGLNVGLYRIINDKHKNGTIRNLAQSAAKEMEIVALALLEDCFEDSPKFQSKLKKYRKELA
jgi:MinD-like ATPase involved in chromosome partitioning or flagellar assembly